MANRTLQERLRSHAVSDRYTDDLLREAAAALDGEEAMRAELSESLHYCNGTCDLAIKHRDEAESKLETVKRICDDAIGFPPASGYEHDEDAGAASLAERIMEALSD